MSAFSGFPNIPPLAIWATQLAWYINPTTGNDSNNGSISLPLKTWTEFRRRHVAIGGFAQNLGNIIVNLMGDLPASDPADLRGFLVPTGTAFIIQGTTTTVYSSTIGVVTAKSPSTNIPWSFTDPALPISWTASSLINKRGRITSGANAGTYFWVAKDLGGKAARISPPILVPLTFPWNNAWFAPTIAHNDPFVIETLTNIDTIIASTGFVNPNTNDGAILRIFFKDIALTNAPSDSISATISAICAFVGCFIPGINSTIEEYYGCHCGVMAALSGTKILVAGSLVDFLSTESGWIVFDDLLTQGGGGSFSRQGLLSSAAGGNNGDWGIFDSIYSVALDSFDGGVCSFAFGGTLYGTNNPVGVRLQNSLFTYTNKPVITGSPNQLIVDNIVKSWATVPYYDYTTGSGVVVAGTSQRASGTQQLNGASVISVSVPSIQATDLVALQKTISAGTQGAYPLVVITAGVGFAISGTASDTSTFAWKLIKG